MRLIKGTQCLVMAETASASDNYSVFYNPQTSLNRGVRKPPISWFLKSIHE